MNALLALFIVKIPSLAGIGGLLAGFLNERLSKALTIGAILGALDGLLFSAIRSGNISAGSFIMGIVAAVAMAALGWFIRLKIRERKKGA